MEKQYNHTNTHSQNTVQNQYTKKHTVSMPKKSKQVLVLPILVEYELFMCWALSVEALAMGQNGSRVEESLALLHGSNTLKLHGITNTFTRQVKWERWKKTQKESNEEKTNWDQITATTTY